MHLSAQRSRPLIGLCIVANGGKKNIAINLAVRDRFSQHILPCKKFWILNLLLRGHRQASNLSINSHRKKKRDKA